MKLTIREYEAEDEGQLKQLLSLCSEDDTILNIINNPKLAFAYVATIQDRLVGLTLAWTSDVHADCMYFRIFSNPFYNRLGIEAKLFSLVEKCNKGHLALQTSTWETFCHLNEFYRKNGFKEIRKTYTPRLTIADTIDHLPIGQTNEKIITLTAMLSDDKLMEKLVTLVKKNYENTHQANPVKMMELTAWRKLILANDLIVDGSYIYLDKLNENIIAYSFLHQSDTKESLELGWCGTADTEYRQLIHQLILQQIGYAMKHDVSFLIGEFDTTNNYAMEVLRHFPFEPCPAWLTYGK